MTSTSRVNLMQSCEGSVYDQYKRLNSKTYSLNRATQSLEYQSSCRVILISEIRPNGDENPVALAIIKQGSKAVIVSLWGLDKIN